MYYENLRINTNSITVTRISDYVTQATSTPVLSASASGYTPLTGNLGYVRYRAMPGAEIVYRNIIFTSRKTDSESITKTFNAAKGTAITYIAGLIASALPAGGGLIINALLSAVVGKLTGNITSDLVFTLDGTAYYYEITASTTDGTGRQSTEDGATYYGKIIKDGTGSGTYRTVYGDYYPEFIMEEDIAVAGWFYNDFFLDTYDVYSFNAS